jgi:hypothetical protein
LGKPALWREGFLTATVRDVVDVPQAGELVQTNRFPTGAVRCDDGDKESQGWSFVVFPSEKSSEIDHRSVPLEQIRNDYSHKAETLSRTAGWPVERNVEDNSPVSYLSC